MFTYVNALASLRGANQRLISTSVRTAKVRELMSTYSQCILILKHPSLETNVSLDVSKVATQFLQSGPDVTVEQWLTANGNKTLPFNTTVPTVVKSSALASEAYAAGYSVKMVHPLSGEGNQYPDAELTHLRLTREGADYSDMYNHLLASVNGLLHLTDAGADGFRIIDGGKCVQLSGRNEVGLISFKNLGKVECFPITSGMVTSRSGKSLSQGAVVTAKNKDFSNKFVMVCIGGYLHTASSQYKVVGKNSVLIEWWKLPIHRRYNETRNLIDWSPVTKLMDQNQLHLGALDLNEMNTDACIKAYLTMSNTFIITVDVPNLFFDTIPLERTGLAGRYYCYTPPTKPLQLDNGHLPPYTIHGQNGMYCLAVDENNRPRYLHDTRDVMDGDNYQNDATDKAPNKEYAQAYFLDMFTETLKY